MSERLSGETPEERLTELGLSLPPSPTPMAAYVPFTFAGELVFTAGVLAQREGKVVVGRLGADLTVEQGVEAGRLAGLSLLALLQAALGRLDRVQGLVLLNAYVRCAPDFVRQSDVADGTSKLLLQVLGDRGHHARVAVGVAELPREACLEVQLTARR